VRALAGFLRLFFRHLYTTLAPAYDLVAWVVSAGQWKHWVLTALQPRPQGPVLELGHGPGHLLRELRLLGIPAVGVDQSAQMGRLARRRLRNRTGHLARADARWLPFPERSFRSVLSTFPPEFILDPLAVSETHRVLQPGGRLLVVVQAQIRGRALYDRAAAWLFARTGQYAELLPGWSEPIASAGFEVQRDDLHLPRARVIRILARRLP
jgi:ubiquinone/menaquinone biosynthesis C-methylase UbiE